ncbi:hypothetical protein BFP72_13850 [Reichenbachiella sp. 5M10]|nr:hypothetical protein BFP72_13850 [Reichenbachiella sp. 5M10]
MLVSCGDDDTSPNEGGAVTVDAGPDQSIGLGETATLQGSGTDANGDDLVFLWVFTQVPSGVSTASVTDPSDPQTTFTPTEAGEYVLELTGVDGQGESDDDEVTITVTGTASDLPIEIGGSIDEDWTLVNRFDDPDKADYIASSNVYLSAILTVEAGVKIVFDDDAGLDVNTSGSVIAIGTQDKPILMTGKQGVVGFWKGINVQSNNTTNALDYVTVEYAGSSGFDGANLLANLMVEDDGRIVVSHSTFSHGNGAGVYVRNVNSKLVDFASNTITANKVPVVALFNHYQYFDVDSDYMGNTDDYIQTEGSSSATTSDVTWGALNVPYMLPGRIQYIESDITVAAGVEIIGQSGSGLEIMSSGSLTAVGTSTDKITFRGDQDLRGVWLGLSFHSNNSANELTYVEFSNGGEKGFDGANLLSNVMVDDAGRLKITHSKLSKSAGYGVYTRDLESTLVDFADNVITDNDAPVMTRYNHYHYFDAASDYSGNTDDYIDSYWGNKESSGARTWQALNVPYRLAPNIEDIYIQVTINAGAEFLGQPNGGFQIQDGGSMKANGTSTDHVVFKGEEDELGYWKGIRFLSNSSNNAFTYTDISNGGEEGFDGANRKANLEVGDGAQFSAENCSFNKSGDAGVRVQSGGVFTNTNNSFSNNTGVDVDS